MAYGERREPQIVRAMLGWTNFNMLAHYAHGFKSDKLEAQGAVLDKLVKSGVNRELVTIEQKRRGQGTCV
jgi:hypothetical protein